jgi:hypothetical protein
MTMHIFKYRYSVYLLGVWRWCWMGEGCTEDGGVMGAHSVSHWWVIKSDKQCKMFAVILIGIMYKIQYYWNKRSGPYWMKRVSFSAWVLRWRPRFIFLYLILCVNIQLNVHFYIFFQITIYSYWSLLADEIWWRFCKRTNWASRKNIKYGLRVFSFLLSFELVIVNTDQESTVLHTSVIYFADDSGKF